MALDEAGLHLRERSVLALSSKVVAIHEGRCVRKDTANKAALVAAEADVLIETEYRTFPLTIAHHTFLGAAGIDESNAGEYLVLLPKDPFQSAANIYHYLSARFRLKEFGIIITDSHSQPFRYGALGVAIGFWGFAPLTDHRGSPDLFGRPLQYERSNLVDGLAAAANVVMGETDDSVPAVLISDIPRIEFTPGNKRDELYAPYGDDSFRVLYERFLT